MHRNDTSSHAEGKRRAAAGFSLVELMIAIGILGVGLAMAAALFPTAIMENQRSANDILGAIMCENALAVAKATVSADNSNLIGLLPPASDPNTDPNFYSISGGSVLTEVDLASPAPRDPNDPNESFDSDWIGDPPDRRPSTASGCLVLARRMTADENDFQIVVVAFRKADPNHTVEARALTVNITDAGEVSVMAVTTGEPNDVMPDSPVIALVDPVSAEVVHVARIVTMRSNIEAVLDRRLPPVNGARAWVVVEIDGGSPVGDTSPAIATLVVRTSLEQ